MDKVKLILKKLYKIIRKQEMNILPGQLAFFLVLSIIPMLTLVAYLFTTFSISIATISEFMIKSFPKEASEILVPMLSPKGVAVNIASFMIIGFFVASNGTHSIILASNMLYGTDTGNYAKQRIKAILMLILLVILIASTAVVLAFSTTIMKTVMEFNLLYQFTDQIYVLIEILKWPISMGLIYFFIKVLYALAPDTPIPSKYMSGGALITTLGWSIATYIYSYYISNFADYGLLYGSLSSIVILMIWVYVLSYIFVLGIAFSASNYKIEKDL